MRFDVILTCADTLATAFADSTVDLIRLDNISANELDVLSKIIERNDGILLAALPYREDSEPTNE